jgi:hypothetical protein
MEALHLKKVQVLVEGPTEQAVFTQAFSPDLWAKGVYLFPQRVGKPGHEGSNDFDMVHKEIMLLLKRQSDTIVTTFFDFYALDNSWPGMIKARKEKNKDIAFKIITQSLADTIIKDMGNDFDPARFIPYVQFHEIEALLFAGPSEMADIFDDRSLKEKFEDIVKECGGCEDINNNYATVPSRRIKKYFSGYIKGRSVNSHAPRIAKRIGVEKIRKECPKFNGWYSQLERLNG